MSDVYTSGSGNWTSPGHGTVDVELWGGGGGSGCGDGGGGGSGGGGGAYLKKTITVTPGQTIAYSVGAGGAGVAYGVGGLASSGGTTTADGGTYTANGGAGGASEDFGGSAAGGTASGGDINTTGSNGGPNAGNTGGTGGASPNGGASQSGSASTVAGVNGNPPGGGAGGAGKSASGATGAAGQASFTFTAATPVVLTSEALWPISGLEEDAANPTWINFSDRMHYPDIYGNANDYVDYSAIGASAGEKRLKFKVEAPTPGYRVTNVKLYVWGFANYDSAGVAQAQISSVRLKIHGTWYDLSIDPVTLSDTAGWHVFELSGISESTNSDDIGFELGITELVGYSLQEINIDVAYLELTYPDLADNSSGFLLWF